MGVSSKPAPKAARTEPTERPVFTRSKSATASASDGADAMTLAMVSSETPSALPARSCSAWGVWLTSRSTASAAPSPARLRRTAAASLSSHADSGCSTSYAASTTSISPSIVSRSPRAFRQPRHQLGPRADARLAKDPGDLVGHGPLGGPARLRDLRVAHSFEDQGRHLGLRPRQEGRRARRENDHDVLLL